jgi:TPR repeat protein
MRFHLICHGALVLLALGCGPSLTPAESAEEANYKYDRQEYADAADLYETACEGGVASACTRLGAMYALGEGVSADQKTAADLFARACDQNDQRGCTMLGRAFVEGKGVAKSQKHGRSLWRGRGMPPDPARGLPLLEKACRAKHAGGCFHLGVLLRMGDRGVTKDPRRAEALLNQACELGEGEACAYLKKHFEALQREQQQAGPAQQDAASEGSSPAQSPSQE